MSLFERLGKKVEEFKQEAEAARDDAAPYRCTECGERFYREQGRCPECGSEEVVALEDESESESASEPESGSDPESESESDSESAVDSESEPEVEPEAEDEQ